MITGKQYISYLRTSLGTVHDGMTPVYFEWIRVQFSQTFFSVVVLGLFQMLEVMYG